VHLVGFIIRMLSNIKAHRDRFCNQNTTHGKFQVILVTQESDLDRGCGYVQGIQTIKSLRSAKD